MADTGAAVSIIPPTMISGHFLQSTLVCISSANGKNIKTHGEVLLQLRLLDLRGTIAWVFVVADVTTPLLDHDFLSHFVLLVDCKATSLRDSTTHLELHGDLRRAPCYVVNEVSSLPKEIQDLLDKYKSVIEPCQVKVEESSAPATNIASHFIDTGSSAPCFASLRGLP